MFIKKYYIMIVKNPEFLLFIEPELPATEPIIDTYTMKMIGAFRNAISGVSNYSHPDQEVWFQPGGGYRGFHLCDCGCAGTSSSCDYLVPTTENIFVHNNKENGPVQGLITNKLCLHYVACHREEISTSTLVQIMLLEGELAEPTEQELKQIFSPKK